MPALHKKYVSSMIGMFGDSTLHGAKCFDSQGKPVEMENFFSRLALDIIGKAVFNYDFDSLSMDDPVIKAVYTVLREAEHRSITPLPYWKDPLLKRIVPRQVSIVTPPQLLSPQGDCLSGPIDLCSLCIKIYGWQV